MREVGEQLFATKISDVEIKSLQRYEFAQKYCSGKDILDAACGCGYGSNILSKEAKSVLGVDYSTEAIDYAQKYWGAKNITFKQSDLNSDLTNLGSFDVIVSLETVEHLDTPIIQTCQRFCQILRPGGLLILSHPEKEAELDSISLLARLKIMAVNIQKMINRWHWKAVFVLWAAIKVRILNKGRNHMSYHKHFNIDGESLKNSLAGIGFQIKDEWYQPGRFYYPYHIIVAEKNE